MLRDKLLLLPQKPGCYLMKNKDGVIIYVGKAKKLKNRVNSYFRGTHTGKTAKLVSEIAKSYPYIELTSESVPRLKVVRNINRKRRANHLFGPYPNVTAAREVVNLLNRIYPLRKCNTYEKTPCLYYHIGQCLGYCALKVEKSKLNDMKSEIIKFLNGDHSIVTIN